MIKLINKTGTTTTDADYPLGKITNNPGDNSGNELDENFFNDYVQLMEKVFNVSGIVANGLPDNDTNGYQMYLAFRAVFRPKKVYKALITQSGTSAPTVTVIENTLGGTVVWARTGTGVYTGTLVGAFTANKTWAIVQSDGGSANPELKRTSDDVVTLKTYNIVPAAADALLTASSLLIEVQD